MAVTSNQILDKKGAGGIVAFPVASGETIYQNTLAIVNASGYLQNLTTTNYKAARMVVVVADDSYNTSGPAATTANGSISGTAEIASAPAGDKTVRQCWTTGLFELTFTAIAQSDLGKTVYVSDNFTADETQIAAIKVGTLVTYISATKGWVDLNKFYQADGYTTWRGSLTFGGTTTGGDVLSWANPMGETIMIKNVVFDITTAASATGITLDVGVASSSTTTSDNLIDGALLDAAIVMNNISDVGTNGRAFRKATSTQYITATPSAAVAAAVGTYEITARIWE